MHKLSIPPRVVERVTRRAGRPHPFDVIAPAKADDAELEAALRWLELERAQQLGSEQDPLLLSVRSGAAVFLEVSDR